jgi:hypothetical protein
MSWRTKCVGLSNSVNKKAYLLKQCAEEIAHRADQIKMTINIFTEDDARDNYRKLASLNDQLDNVIPTVNRIARGTYGSLRQRNIQD